MPLSGRDADSAGGRRGGGGEDSDGLALTAAAAAAGLGEGGGEADAACMGETRFGEPEGLAEAPRAESTRRKAFALESEAGKEEEEAAGVA